MWSQLMAGGNSVRKRMALALSQIFVVSTVGLNIPWPSQAIGDYWDILNKHAFGRYRDLLEAVALSPAMGAYLNMKGSQRADPATGRVPDENFAREIMQLFSIGLVHLNVDGTPKIVDGAPVETYTNADVEGLAKAFTGWNFDYSDVTIHPPPTPGLKVPDAKLVRRPMTSDPMRWNPPSQQSTHSLEGKRFLGVTIPAGTGPVESMKIALDTIAAHPNVGPFISRQLIQRLVTSNPSPAYISRVASVFNDNGNNVRGDLGAVFRAIILDPEANDPSMITNPFYGKLREPMLRFAQWGRTFSVQFEPEAWSIRDLSLDHLLGQAPFRSPSVFNFYRPDYVPPQSQALANRMVAPEFQIADETTVATYVNFIFNSIKGNVYWFEGIKPDYKPYLALANNPQQLLNILDLALTAGQLSEFAKTTIIDAVKRIPISGESDDDGLGERTILAISLVMCSTDYLIQK